MARSLSEPVGARISLRARMVSKSGPKWRIEALPHSYVRASITMLKGPLIARRMRGVSLRTYALGELTGSNEARTVGQSIHC